MSNNPYLPPETHPGAAPTAFTLAERVASGITFFAILSFASAFLAANVSEEPAWMHFYAMAVYGMSSAPIGVIVTFAVWLGRRRRFMFWLGCINVLVSLYVPTFWFALTHAPRYQ